MRARSRNQRRQVGYTLDGRRERKEQAHGGCNCVTRVVLLALAVLQMCQAGGVAGSGSVTNLSGGWCCWLWQCYKCVTRVVLLALAVLQMCHAGGVAGSGSVTNVSRRRSRLTPTWMHRPVSDCHSLRDPPSPAVRK
jgi:hypothetical protein